VDPYRANHVTRRVASQPECSFGVIILTVLALAPTDVHVVDGTSGWDQFVGVCTILATVVGFAAIVLTIRQGQRAQADLVLDRRATFELGVIAEASRLYEQLTWQTNVYSGLVRMLPEAEFPTLHEWALEPDEHRDIEDNQTRQDMVLATTKECSP
jgi:hypothetical protein